MLRAMSSILTEPAAATVLVIDEATSATLTEIARTTGRPLSSIQRAVDGLIRSNVLVRETARGPLRFTGSAPRKALRELASWRLGADQAGKIKRASQTQWPNVPATIRDERIRAAWPKAIGSIVSAYRPERVILFGSQARGDADSDSDVDLLVVFSEEIDRRERRVEILSLLRSMPFTKDILVATTANVARPLIGSALADAIGEGVTVYER